VQEADDTSQPVERFQALYESCYQAVYAYVWRRVPGNPDEVPDVVADIFAIVWRRVGDLPAPPRDRLWLYGVARRVVLDHKRRSTRKLRLEGLLRADARVSPREHPWSDPAHLRVRQAVERLRGGEREALRLVAWDGLSHAEAAEVLGCSVNALSLRVSKAKARLRGELSAAGPAQPSHSHRDAAPGSVPSSHF
jgi:RNA polymerase sigma-70 factor, ECF subfamily